MSETLFCVTYRRWPSLRALLKLNTRIPTGRSNEVDGLGLGSYVFHAWFRRACLGRLVITPVPAQSKAGINLFYLLDGLDVSRELIVKIL